jgi:hypothetical protein
MHLVLLLDEKLFTLPLEMLPGLQLPHIKSISRDFSLHVFSARSAVLPTGAADQQQVAKDTKPKGALPKGKVKTNDDASSVLVESGKVAYVIDPLCETQGNV